MVARSSCGSLLQSSTVPTSALPDIETLHDRRYSKYRLRQAALIWFESYCFFSFNYGSIWIPSNCVLARELVSQREIRYCSLWRMLARCSLHAPVGGAWRTDRTVSRWLLSLQIEQIMQPYHHTSMNDEPKEMAIMPDSNCINIATISAGFEKGDFLVREEQGNRVYFDFFEEVRLGCSRIP